MAAVEERRFDSAAAVLADGVAERKISAATICVRQRGEEFAQAFGAAKSIDAIFLLASISKPISAAALMTLFDTGGFRLDDKVARFIPDFTGDGREQITVEQLLTHISGLPDQLPDNPSLRSAHAPLSEYVAKTIRTPLLFMPGSKYSYSSMGILLASEIARRISGQAFSRLVEQSVFKPLDMKYSALGLGSFKLEETMHCQMELAAAGSGWRRSERKRLGLEQPLLAAIRLTMGRSACLGPGCGKVFCRVSARHGQSSSNRKPRG